jgi:hypothetical protein
MGFICEYFNLVGKTPRLNDLLHMYVNGAKINGRLILRICCGISSYLYEYFHFNDFTMSLTSLLVTGVICMFGKGLKFYKFFSSLCMPHVYPFYPT